VQLKPILDTLERMRCGGIILGSSQHVVEWNATAKRILENELGKPQQRETAGLALIDIVGKSERSLHPDVDAWLVIPRGERRSLVLHAIHTPEQRPSDPHSLVILIDFDETPLPNPAALQRLFRLSPAEARLALCIFRGETPTEIAASSGVKLATVRTQLASIFYKTRTKRQSQLVALLARVAILP
jgi:DNA-binding CsgD family transcriptional regulator